jgi:hypothetical protein
MKIFKSVSIYFAGGIVTALLMAAAPLARAQTIWNGPSITFSHTPQNGQKDQMTPGVAITRGSSGGLYNAVTESSATSGISPKDTQWALGSLADFSTLKYGACPLEAGNRPPNDVGKTYVVHLVTENIYLSLTLTGWGGAGETGNTTFSYTRTTPPAAAPTPTVSITSPASGAVFPAPANVGITANATVSSGTVTNVQFFSNGSSVGTALTAPFSVTANNLAAGAYALTAVATAAGVSATSAVVTITVTAVSAPTVTVTITNPPAGAVFAAPANVTVAANATASSGTVTNVQFFTNGISLGTVLTAPFSVTANNLAAGTYALTAVATAGGISATSAVVSVSVVNPPPVTLSGASITAGQFTFNCTADAGMSYVAQSTSNLVDWVSVATNVASGSSVSFSQPYNPSGGTFYRVGLLPNP